MLNGARDVFAIIGLLFVLYAAYLLVSSKIECWGAPPLVEFHQGMALCPGQSAVWRPFVGGDKGAGSEQPPVY